MITYNELYELLRKEKYSEQLQLLPGNFIAEISVFLREQYTTSSTQETPFLEGAMKSKKQLENSIALFKELILRRKRKLLALVLVANETGILKRDYETMLAFEREIFDTFVKTLEMGDRELSRLLHGVTTAEKPSHAMVLFTQDTEQFVDLSGNVVGPFSSGQLVNLDSAVSSILVSSGKAQYVDEQRA